MGREAREALDTTQHRTTEPVLDGQGPNGMPIRVLVADDNIVSRRPVEVVLEKWGYDVVTASSGSEAWAILSSDNPPRIAILDWMMPGLSGPEVCQLVRQHKREYYTYILMLTSRYEREDFIVGMESGADDYLVKPPNHRELKVRLGPARRIVALEAELLRMKEDLKFQASRDPLTSLWNRNAIFDILAREVSRCERENIPLGLLLGDIDHFKLVNDTYGHLVGDDVLRAAADRMIRSVRPYDSVGRYGGEEFLIILPGCDQQAAERRAEAIRQAVENPPLTVEGKAYPITISFGATCIQNTGNMAATQKLVQLVDAALYEAKHQGRNRTVSVPFA
jgi:two-component system, cell cycle response regulator